MAIHIFENPFGVWKTYVHGKELRFDILCDDAHPHTLLNIKYIVIQQLDKKYGEDIRHEFTRFVRKNDKLELHKLSWRSINQEIGP